MTRTRVMALDVVTAAYDRFRRLYDGGDRVVVSSSGGKDSTVCVELAVMAARDTGNLPVEVVMRDEEVMLPGTFEYVERLAQRTDEVDLHWVVAGQPIVNIFNRFNPYFWVFDQSLDPDEWVRKWPGFDRGNGPETPPLPGRQPYWTPHQNIQALCSIERFPPKWPEERLAEFREPDGSFRLKGKHGLIGGYYGHRGEPRLVSVMGLRAAESPRRKMGLLSKKGYVSLGPDTNYGAWTATPIYDWQDGDVWKFLADGGHDYNTAYDTMRRMGVPRRHLRIAPPTLTAAGISQMQAASRAWPQWFDRVARRLDGVRTVAQFGKRAITPNRRMGETWEECFYREVIDPPRVPDWIRDRAMTVRDARLASHARHSQTAFPDATKCPGCSFLCCWKDLTTAVFNGDPFGMVCPMLEPIQPEFFRPGSGTWGFGGAAFK